jgi:hypothetical protein
MTRPHLLRSLLLLTLIASSVGMAAQEIRIGALEGNYATFTGSPITVIDWSHPALGSGTVNTATIGWANATTPCDNIFYVRFYAIPSNALTTVMTAERGPFRAVNGMNTVALEPAVSVTPETYIGVRRVDGPDSCGVPFGTFTRQPSRALGSSTDFKNGSLTGLQPFALYSLQAQASNVPSVRVGTIPVVGSVAGGFGSFFRTSLTLSNPRPLEIRGKLVFHPSGASGSSTDPSLDYVIPANGTLNYADILASMSQTGLGSLDVLTTGSPTPVATARVFNDTGVTGTSGFSEDAVPVGAPYYSVANILIPADLTNYRLNIGLRSFTAGDLNVAVYDAAGALQSSLVKSYSADFFEQVTAAAFLGANPPAGGRIVISAFQRPFIAYGAVTDNRTNDPSMRVGAD